MSGHSKWSTIKHKKAAADAKRGKVFTRFIREITVAARLAGGDVDSNPRLRAAVNAARAVNMPKDNIDRAISRGAGGSDGANIEEVRYEGYGQNGVAIIVDCMTDNRNRTVSDVRSAFNKGGGSMGETGCVSWMFHQKGLFIFDRTNTAEETLLEIGMENGAEDVVDKPDEGAIEVTCASADFLTLQDAFERVGLNPEVEEISWIPETYVEVKGEEAEKVFRLVERLEDLDDVQNVFTNFDISEEEMVRLNA